MLFEHKMKLRVGDSAGSWTSWAAMSDISSELLYRNGEITSISCIQIGFKLISSDVIAFPNLFTVDSELNIVWTLYTVTFWPLTKTCQWQWQIQYLRKVFKSIYF